MIDPIEMRPRILGNLLSRFDGLALGPLTPRSASPAAPLPADRQQYWQDRALEALAEDKNTRVEKYDSGRGYQVHLLHTKSPTPKAKPAARTAPPRAPRPAAATGPDRDTVRSFALTHGVSELAAREYLKGVTE